MNAPDCLKALSQAGLGGYGDGVPGAAPPLPLLQALFERSPTGLKLVDGRTLQTVAVNAAMAELLGHEASALAGTKGLSRVDAESAADYQSLFDADAPEDHAGPVELVYRTPQGAGRRLLCQTVRVRDTNAHPWFWFQAVDVTAERALQEQLRTEADRDRLTGLLNRRALGEVMVVADAQERLSPRGLAVLFLDFDRFKLVNDTLGHGAGDALLCSIAERLTAAADAARGLDGPRWYIARFGGDEFVVVLHGGADQTTACDIAEGLLHRLAQPHRISGQDIHSTASIGIAMWGPHLQRPDCVLRDADIAMYEAKRSGRGRWTVFDDDMRSRLQRAAIIEKELRHAVALNQLHAVYQPIVDLETGAMSSVEALLRWEHPALGAVSPAEFIPVAEESGLIMPLGEWVLREGCRQWTLWQQLDPTKAPATMSVNLSREQVALGQRVLTVVREALADADMPASALQLEITEREVMKNPEQARALLDELSAMGVRLAMDDFGTGTSSLGCLREYPFDVIKIDKSFVTNVCRDPQVLAVAHATVNVIENLGMVSVAEGIEDPEEVAVLQAMGCRYGQGYLFARPVRGDQLLQAYDGPSDPAQPALS